MEAAASFALSVYMITTAITPRKIIAGVVVLVIVIAGVVWWMGRSRGRGA
jgi:hypothetical protein